MSALAEMLALSEMGDNATVDILIGDIYGTDYSKMGLKSTTIASSFGKVFQNRGEGKVQGERGTFRAEDISRSLLYAVSNNIGQIASVASSEDRFIWWIPADDAWLQLYERRKVWPRQDLLRWLLHPWYVFIQSNVFDS